ncbi:MAG: WD40 repeat domain-containing protein [Bryobacteraceae bacterium]|nr:WD40 repeat domain-containing protein [Bryobacteraceae bacterium]
MPGSRIVLWDLVTGKPLDTLALTADAELVSYAPDGVRFAVVYPREGNRSVTVHSFGRETPWVHRQHAAVIGWLEWHPAGRWIALADFGSSVQLMDPRTGETRELGRHKAEAVLARFSPDGHYLISAGWERELACWDLRSMRRVFTMGLDSFRLQFREDSAQCAVVTETEEKLLLYTFEQPTEHREFTEDLGPRLEQAVFSRDGRWLAAAAADYLAVWDCTMPGSGALTKEGAEGRLFFRPDGSELFASCRDDDAARWQITPGPADGGAPQLRRLPWPKPEGFTSLCVVSNEVAVTGVRGTQLLTADMSLADDRWVAMSQGISGASPDGRWLAMYRPYSDTLRVYRMPTVEEAARLMGAGGIRGFQFSPRGDLLAVAFRQQVKLWQTSTWKQARTVTNAIGLLFMPDGRGWWLTRDFRTAGLHDPATLELLLPLPVGMLPLAVSPDGRRLAVSVNRRHLQLWDLTRVRHRLRELQLDWEDPATSLPANPPP